MYNSVDSRNDSKELWTVAHNSHNKYITSGEYVWLNVYEYEWIWQMFSLVSQRVKITRGRRRRESNRCVLSLFSVRHFHLSVYIEWANKTHCEQWKMMKSRTIIALELWVRSIWCSALSAIVNIYMIVDPKTLFAIKYLCNDGNDVAFCAIV